jgi:hypothetical protein
VRQSARARAIGGIIREVAGTVFAASKTGG